MLFVCRFWRAVGSYRLTKSSLMRISYSQRLHNLKQSFSAVRTNRQINLTCSIVLWPEYLTLVQSFTLLLSISYSVVSLRWSSHVYIWAAHGGMCYVLWVSWLGAKEYIFSKKGAKNMFWACSLVLTYRCKLQLFSPALNVPVLFQTQGLYSFCMLFAVWKILFWF